MHNSFTLKEIEVHITLGSGTFDGAANTKVIKGLATKVQIEKVALPDKNKAKVDIYGLSLTAMEQLTTLNFRPLECQKNLITILAGSKEQEVSQIFPVIFKGEIVSAWADFNQAPDIIFKIEALSAYCPALKALSPTALATESLTGDILQQLATQAEYSYINQGVNSSVQSLYLSGSPIQQAQTFAKEQGFDLIIDDNTIISLPANKARQDSTVFLSKETGLIGYPTFNQDGIVAKCFFEPTLSFGGLVKIESLVPKASGTWKITKLNHNIIANDSNGGSWESSFEGVYYE